VFDKLIAQTLLIDRRLDRLSDGTIDSTVDVVQSLGDRKHSLNVLVTDLEPRWGLSSEIPVCLLQLHPSIQSLKLVIA